MKNSNKYYQVKGTPFFVWKSYNDFECPMWVIDSNNKDLIDEMIADYQDQAWWYKAEAMQEAKEWWEKRENEIREIKEWTKKEFGIVVL